MAYRNSTLQRIGLAIVLAIGFGLAIGFAFGWSMFIAESYANRDTAYEQVQVRQDGTPLISRYSYGADGIAYYTLDRQEVSLPRNQHWRPQVFLTAPPKPSWLLDLTAAERIAAFSDGQQHPVLWYFVHDGRRDGRGYFVGIDKTSKLQVGYIGRRGFVPTPPSADEQFPVDGEKMGRNMVFSRRTRIYYGYSLDYDLDLEEDSRGKIAMISDKELLRIDFRSRSVTTLMESPDLVTVVSVESFPPATAQETSEPPHGKQVLVVRTLDQILLLDWDGKQIASYAIPAELSNKQFNFCELKPSSALLIWDRRLPDHSTRQQLWWIDGAGKVSRQKELALVGRSSQPINETAIAWAAAVAVPAPIAATFVTTVVVPVDHLEARVEPDYTAALPRSFSETWPPLVTIFVLGAVLAWLCYRRQRRCALAGTWAWVVFVFIAGVPGLLAYRFHRRWPILEKCPACGHTVPHDRDACSACDAEFPPPKPKGIEVFA